MYPWQSGKTNKNLVYNCLIHLIIRIKIMNGGSCSSYNSKSIFFQSLLYIGYMFSYVFNTYLHMLHISVHIHRHIITVSNTCNHAYVTHMHSHTHTQQQHKLILTINKTNKKRIIAQKIISNVSPACRALHGGAV